MKKTLKIILASLVLIGALNWGLVGFFGFDIVRYLLGDMTVWSRIVYSIIGVSALLAMLCCWISGDCGCTNSDCGC